MNPRRAPGMSRQRSPTDKRAGLRLDTPPPRSAVALDWRMRMSSDDWNPSFSCSRATTSYAKAVWAFGRSSTVAVPAALAARSVARDPAASMDHVVVRALPAGLPHHLASNLAVVEAKGPLSCRSTGMAAACPRIESSPRRGECRAPRVRSFRKIALPGCRASPVRGLGTTPWCLFPATRSAAKSCTGCATCAILWQDALLPVGLPEDACNSVIRRNQPPSGGLQCQTTS